jgi:hypothetical protein
MGVSSVWRQLDQFTIALMLGNDVAVKPGNGSLAGRTLPDGTDVVESIAEKPHDSNHYCENDGEHYCVLSDVLAVVLPPQLVKIMSQHFAPQFLHHS